MKSFLGWGAAVLIIGSILIVSLRTKDGGGAGPGPVHPGWTDSILNPLLIEVIEDYPRDGRFRVLPSAEINTSMGTTQDLYYLGKRRIIGDSQRRSYCSGLMLEAYLRACALYSPNFVLPTVGDRDFVEFRREFYGFYGDERTLVGALTDRGLAIEVESVQDAIPGDFIQFWRNSGSGHSAVLMDAQFDQEGMPLELEFWSVHQETGVSFKRETVGDDHRMIDANRIFIARAFVPFIQ